MEGARDWGLAPRFGVVARLAVDGSTIVFGGAPMEFPASLFMALMDRTAVAPIGERTVTTSGTHQPMQDPSNSLIQFDVACV